jgi:hypothetical protein
MKVKCFGLRNSDSNNARSEIALASERNNYETEYIAYSENFRFCASSEALSIVFDMSDMTARS